MKKLISLLLVLVMVLGLVACGGSSAPATEAPKADAPQAEAPAADPNARPFEGRTLTIAHGHHAYADAYNAQFAAFEEKYGCTIEVEMLSENADEQESLMLTRAATGTLPDVFPSNVGAKLQEFDPANNIMDLAGQPFLDRVVEDFLPAVDGPNGEIYGVPSRTVNVAGIFYNKKVYEELNLEIPKTWDEFIANCEVIKQSGITPIAAAYDAAAGRQILFLSQYYYVKDENPDFAMQYQNREIELHESESYMRGVEKLAQIYELGYINDDPLAMSFDDSAIAIAEGSHVHTFARTNLISQVVSLCPEYIEDIGFFPLPDLDPENRGVAVWLPTCWCISKNTENADMALALLEFLISDEGLAAYSGAITMAGAFAIKGATLPEGVPSSIATAQEWVGIASATVMEYDCDIKGPNMSSFLAMVGTGDLSPEQGIAEIEADNAIDAQQKGLPGW